MDREQVSQLVEKLDTLVPREGAAVQIQLDDEGATIFGNRNGYLRSAIELLKSVNVAGTGKGERLEVDWSYLISKDSDSVDYTPLLVDELPQRKIATRTERGWDVGWLIFGFITVLVFLAAIGGVAIVRWIWWR